MKQKRRAALALICAAALLSGCGAEADPLPPDPAPAAASAAAAPAPPDTPEEPAWSFEGTVLRCGNAEFEITGREPAVNAVMGCTPVGEYLIVEGHINPRVSYYGVLNRESLLFEADLLGTNLTWRDGDVSTIVYACGPEIYAYDGTLIGTCDAGEFDMIREIVFVNENTEIEVEIEPVEGEPYTVTFALPTPS